MVAAEMLIALAFGTLKSLMYFHNSFLESVRIDNNARHRHPVGMQAGKESFPICGGGSFLPTAAHVSYPVKGFAWLWNSMKTELLW